MRQWGTYFMRLGIGAFVFPIFGLQARGMSAFGESLPFVAGCVAVAGLALVGWSHRRGQ
jgi:hypothetical protein